MNLFAYIRHNQGLTDDANFMTFWNSFFLLFKSSTGENWNYVMADLVRVQQPNNVCF
jgi:hypothetical protein